MRVLNTLGFSPQLTKTQLKSQWITTLNYNTQYSLFIITTHIT